MGKGCAQGGGGANPCSSWVLRVLLSTHQSLLHCALSLAIHFNGLNGTAYTRPSKVQNNPAEFRQTLKTGNQFFS
jgi:hypothetical protein